MRAVVQRVTKAQVKVENEAVGEISQGLLVLLAIHQADDEKKIEKMADKLISLRIFEDSQGKMNLSVREIGGEIMIISQFTLYGNTTGGNRPSFTEAARPEMAEKFYEQVVTKIRAERIKVATGRFGAHMQVSLLNDGPVTTIIDI